MMMMMIMMMVMMMMMTVTLTHRQSKEVSERGGSIASFYIIHININSLVVIILIKILQLTTS
jgi:hypothetical protein